jgi:DNA-binding NarL/FixJ family response regulator
MRVVLVEDDFLEAEWAQRLLEESFPGASIDVIRTEKEFRLVFPKIASNPPDVVILDMMLPWTDIDDAGPSSDKPDGSFVNAGARCLSLLRADAHTANVPAVIYTTLDRMDLVDVPAGVVYVRKDAPDERLVRVIKNVLSASRQRPAAELDHHHTSSSGGAAGRGRDSVFISYSHKDKKFLEELLGHLKPLTRAGQISVWSDKQIYPGAVWLDEIKNALKTAAIAVLLVTKDFLASDFIHEHELGPLLSEAAKDGVRIVWIPVRASSYKQTALKDYQAVISPEKPLAEMKAERDRAWVTICEAIRKAAESS